MEDDAAGRDGGRTRVGVRAGQRQRVGAGLGERAGAADGVSEGQRVGAVEDERGVVDHRTAEDAGRTARADLQRTGADRRGAGEGIGAGQGQFEQTKLGETEAVAAVGDHARHREVGGVRPGGDGAVAGQSDVAREVDGAGRDPGVGMQEA